MNSPVVMDILLVEDNPDHAELTRRALRQGGSHKIVWVKDGQEALDFLNRQGAWASHNGASPSVILLDIGLPKVSGHEVLRSVKGNDRLRCIPVIMLSTSGDPDDVTKSYNAGANSYVVKASDFTDFVGRVKAIKEYWVNTNVFPEAFDLMVPA
jgi:DNA-binding response OmpR family regulator